MQQRDSQIVLTVSQPSFANRLKSSEIPLCRSAAYSHQMQSELSLCHRQMSKDDFNEKHTQRSLGTLIVLRWVRHLLDFSPNTKYEAHSGNGYFTRPDINT